MGSRTLALGVLVAVCAGSGVAEELEVVLREGTNFAVALSPVDDSFILDLQGTLWRLPGDGGEATALTDGMGDDRMPHISPDGARVVFQSYRAGTWDIWAANVDGSALTALTDSRFDDREPVFSPDGTRVAFSSDRNGNYDIWVLDLEAQELEALTRHEANDFMPAWSPSGDAIAFVSERDSEPALYRLEPGLDGEPSRLASFDGRIAAPSWSPNGSRIALRLLELGSMSADALGPAPASSRLVLVSVDSGEVVDVAGPEDVFPFRTEWSGDTEIVYTAAGSLWRQSLEGGAEASAIPFEATVVLDRSPYRRRDVELIEDGEELPVRGIVRPVVSPDGTTIAFAALGDIWTVSSQGGEPVALTRDEHLDSDPSWSPDSSALVYSSDRVGTMDLWVKSVSALHRTRGRQLTFAIGAEMAPAWSPDGTKVAYVDERSRIHVVSATGGDDEVLSSPRRGVSQPSWSRDSNYLTFAVHEPISSRFREGYNRIHVLDTRSGLSGLSRVLEQPQGSVGARDGDGPVWSPDGRSMAFAMEGGLWVMPVALDGTPRDVPREVVREAVDFPSWLPDSASILFVGPRGMKRVDLVSERASYVGVRHHYRAISADGRFMIRDVRVVDSRHPTAAEHQDVVIEGNRIESIEPTLAIPPQDMRVIDGAGKTLIPGLIEMHTHLSLPAWGSQHGKVWLAYGITSIRTLADSPYRALEERESVRAGRRIGPRVFMTGAAMDGDRVYYTSYLAIGDEEELAREMQRAFDIGYDLVKTYVRLPDDLQKLAIEEAHRQGIFVTSHELYPALAYGVDGVEHVAGTSRRGYSPKLSDLSRSYDDVIELIGRSGVYFTPTVLIYGGWSLALAREPELVRERRFETLFPAWAQERFKSAPVTENVDAAREVVAPIFETVRGVSDRGGRILAGTDSPIVPYGLSLLLEIEQLAEAGLSPMEALGSATRVAAEALGVGDELGTIEVGKIADLVLLGGNPLEDIRNLRKTEVVIVNGRLVTVEQLLRNP